MISVIVALRRSVQGVLGGSELAVLRRRVQTAKLRFQLYIFNQNSTQRTPHVTIGTRQDFIYRRLERISFHRIITA
jgi:hypothetical protein